MKGKQRQHFHPLPAHSSSPCQPCLDSQDAGVCIASQTKKQAARRAQGEVETREEEWETGCGREKMVAQGKKMPQRSEECNVALVEGKEDAVCGGSATRKQDDAGTRYDELWGNAPDRTLRRGDVGAMIGRD